MDITGDRWDTPLHDDSPARESEPDDINHFYGWFGNMFRLRGGSAMDVAKSFYYVWNDPAPLPLEMRVYNMEPYTWESRPTSPVGNLTVQIVKTLGCKAATSGGLYSNFAPTGEYSFLAAFTKMAQNAKKYIYLEEMLR